jgi:hypothetical protein
MFSKFANYEPVIKRGHDMTHWCNKQQPQFHSKEDMTWHTDAISSSPNSTNGLMHYKDDNQHITFKLLISICNCESKDHKKTTITRCQVQKAYVSCIQLKPNYQAATGGFLQGINTTYQSFVNTSQKQWTVFRFKRPAHAQIHYITATLSFQLTQPQKLWTVFRFSRATTVVLKFAMIKIKSKKPANWYNY